MKVKKLISLAAAAVTALCCCVAPASAEGTNSITGTANEGTYSWTFTGDGTTGATTYTVDDEYAKAEFHLGDGDSITSSGKIDFKNPSVKEENTSGYANVNDTGRYIKITPKNDGTLSIKLDAATSNNARFTMACEEYDAEANIDLTQLKKMDASGAFLNCVAKNGWTNDATASKALTAGKTYILYTYNKECNIKSLTLTYPTSTETTTGMTKISTINGTEDKSSTVADVFWGTTTIESGQTKTVSVSLQDGSGNAVKGVEAKTTEITGTTVDFAVIIEYSNGSNLGYVPVYTIQ